MQLFVTIGDIFGIAMFAIFALIALLAWASTAWKQWRCKHENVRPNREIRSICRDCGKDLGSYIAWQKAQKQEQPCNQQ